MAELIRVLVVDDHRVVRMGLQTLMSVVDDLECVGEAGDGQEALELVGELCPDVVLMDLKMPVMDGPTAIARIRADYPSVGVVALTSLEDESMAARALEAGAIGYLFKDAGEDELVGAIRLAAKGQGVVAPGAMRALVARRTAAQYEVQLTEREEEVLRLVGRGFTNPQIADSLGISVSTVSFHVHNVLDKLGAKTRTEAVSIAAREGLIDI